MPEQFFLPGLAPRAERDFLFFALLPSPSAALRVAHLRDRLCREWGLSGRGPIAQECFHVTLHGIGEYDGVPEGVVRQAEAAAALVCARPFKIAFDRAMTFPRNRDTQPLILRSVRAPPELVALHDSLGDAMKRVGFRRVRKSGFTPHLTLLYEDCAVAEREIETINVNAKDFALVWSLRGRGPNRHVALGRWRLSQSPRNDFERAGSPVYAKSRSAVHQGVAVPQGVLNLPV